MLTFKIIKVLLLLALLTNANLFAEKLPIYEQYEQEIVRAYADEMSKQYELLYIGGGGRMHHNIEKISVKFIAYKKATVAEARELEVKAIERLLCLINEDSKIRPYLNEYPFTRNSVSVSVGFRMPKDDRWPLDGSVTFVFLAHNTLFYHSAKTIKQKPQIIGTDGKLIEYPETETDILVPLTEEPYDEALSIVQKGPSCFKNRLLTGITLHADFQNH